MRKTTTSLAIFCSAVILAASCGKRGDPLPPLRPYPASADGLTVRQIGDRVRLEWRAPVRNTDGTTEKLELRDVEVRRRIVDLPALVAAQTKTIEPKTQDEAEESAPGEESAVSGVVEREATEPPEVPRGNEPAEPGELSAPADEPPADEPPADEPPADEPPADELSADPAVPGAERAPEQPAVPLPAQAPATPVLQLGEFAPDSRYVATLESTEPGAPMTFEEPIDPAWLGSRIQYAVVYTNRGNRRGPRSTAVALDPVPALVAPDELHTETGDGFVALRWSSPEPDSYFSIFRRREDAPTYPDNPLNAVPIAETVYEDRSVTFGVGTCYRIRTVPEPPPPPPPPADPLTDVVPDPSSVLEAVPRSLPVPDSVVDAVADSLPPVPVPVPDAAPVPDPELEPEPATDVATIIVPEVPPVSNPVRIESEASPEVCLVPTDTFAPPPPTGLVAVRSGEEVLLTWTEVERADVIGYRVYRAPDDDEPFELLTEDLLRVPSFSDDTVESGETYYYAVTAIDDSPAANESAKSELSQVTFTR